MIEYRTTYGWSPRLGQNGDQALQTFVTGLCELVHGYLGMNGEEPAANVKASFVSAFREAVATSPFPASQIYAELGKSCSGWSGAQSAFVAEAPPAPAPEPSPTQPNGNGGVLLPLLFTGALAFVIFDISTGQPGVVGRLVGVKR